MKRRQLPVVEIFFLKNVLVGDLVYVISENTIPKIAIKEVSRDNLQRMKISALHIGDVSLLLPWVSYTFSF